MKYIITGLPMIFLIVGFICSNVYINKKNKEELKEINEVKTSEQDEYIAKFF